MENENKNKKYCFNVFLMGDSNVGKQEIMQKYTKEVLYTIGANCSFKNIILKSGIKITLKLIDTVGQEKYRFSCSAYFKNTNAFLCLFSLDNLESFYFIQNRIEIFENNNQREIVKYLVGNYNSSKNRVEYELIEN